MRIFACVIAVGLAGCTKSEQSHQVQQSQDSISAVGTTQPIAPQVHFVDSASPRLVIDSAAREPRLELRGGVFIVHLPPEMARVLEDKLPGFAPMSRASFDAGLIAWRDHEAADPQLPSLDPADSDAVWASALSVAIGDFDGDSTRDVAMEGMAGDMYAAFFLLSPSHSKSKPTLLFFRDPVKGTWSQTDRSFIDYFTLVRPGNVTGFSEEADDAPMLDLRHDAVDYGSYGKASELYYVENGIVQVFTTSD